MQNPVKLAVALAVVAASLTLGGCFHHHQKTYTTEVLPPAAPPLK
ncbi:hypothetical protein V6C03_13080 [Methyloligella sp. 2.7D]|nr:hypothetical protein [Methyloligella sp. GL2]